MKKCSTCKLPKPEKSFRKDASRKDGKHRTCDDCNNEIQRNWYQRNKKKAQKDALIRYHKNKKKINARRKADRKKNPDKYKPKNRKYDPKKSKLSGWKAAGINMTHELYEDLLKIQKNKCAICEEPREKFKRNFNVDHCHETGKVRGLLCNRCNGALGYFNDDIKIFENAIKYLKKYGKRV